MEEQRPADSQPEQGEQQPAMDEATAPVIDSPGVVESDGSPSPPTHRPAKETTTF